MGAKIRVSESGYCPRRIVLGGLGITPEPYSEGTRRAFDEGNLHESSILDWAEENLPNGPYKIVLRQTELQLDGWLSGHPDGVARYEPWAMQPWAGLVEAKCLSSRSFKALRTDGVFAAFPQYYAQMQLYMYLFDTERQLTLTGGWIVARDKDTPRTRRWDHHYEWVPFDRAYAVDTITRLLALKYTIERGEDIAPPKDPRNEADWECRAPWCPFAKFCHPDFYKAKPGFVRADELEDAVLRYNELGDMISALDAERNTLKEALTSTAHEGPVVAGKFLVELRPQRRETIDNKLARKVLDKPTLASILKVQDIKTLRVEEAQ